MSFLEFVNCCFSEDIPREDINKLLLVYSDKTLTHYQKCVIDQKTISKTVCYTISKTQELLNGKFASSTKKKLSQNYVLLLICRESFLRFSTRMINFFEFPLTLRRLKPPGFEYFFFVMDQNELKGLDEEKKDSILQMSHLTSLLEKGNICKFCIFDIV